MVILLLWLIVVGYTSWNLNRRYFYSDSIPKTILGICTVFYGEIVLIFSILGISGNISVLNFSIVILLVFASSFFLHNPPSICWDRLTLSNVEFSLIFLTALLYLNLFFVGRCFLPVLTTDGLLYHMPFPIHWLKTGKLDYIPVYFNDVIMTYYPVGGEMIYLFFMAPLKDSSFLSFVQTPFVLYASTALFLLARQIGLSRREGIVAACFFALLKPVYWESQNVFVDLISAGFFLAALYYLCYGKEEKDIILGAINAGLFINIKTINILFLLPVLLLTVKRYFKEGAKGNSVRALIASGCFLVFGAYVYIKNWVITGNPFFPAEVKLGAVKIFDGLYRYEVVPAISRIKNFLVSWFSSGTMSKSNFSIFLTAGWLAGIIAAIGKWGVVQLLLLPFLLAFFYSLFVPPYYYQARHLLLAYPIIVLGIVYLVDRIFSFRKTIPRGREIFLFVILSSILVQITPYLSYLPLFSVIYCAAVAAVVLLRKRFMEMAGWFQWGCFAILLFICFSHTAFYAWKSGECKFPIWKHFYGGQAEAWEWFSLHSGGESRVIAYVGDFLLYPLYGQNFQNTVYYQPVNSIEERLLHEYGRDEKILVPSEHKKVEEIFRRDPDSQIWHKGLKRHDADWLLIKKETGRIFIEEKWAAEQPENFHLVFENNFAKIYDCK